MMKGLWETAEDALGWLLFVPWAFCSVQNRVFRILPLCHDPPRRRARTSTHTQMHGRKQARWQSRLGNSLRTPRQPDTLPNTTLAHTHAHKHTHRTLPLWAAGRLALAPEKAGRYFARLRFSVLRKGTQTQAGEWQPNATAL